MALPDSERLFVAGSHRDPPIMVPSLRPGAVYVEWMPPRELRPAVFRFWAGCQAADPSDRERERVVPDGRITIAFDVGGPGWTGHAPRAFVVGPTLRWASVRFPSPSHRIGLRLRRWSGGPVLGIPADELTDRVIPLEDLWGPEAVEYASRIAEADTRSEQLELLERLLLERLETASGPDGPLAEALAHLHRSDGALSVSELAAASAVSTRHLQRLFRDAVGLAPKELSRHQRFRASVRLIHGQPSWPLHRIAYRCGFYDQAHFTREFRAFTGLTPGAYRTIVGS